MPVERHRPQATITTVPRSTLAHVHHKEIDNVLKDLKFCSRRLKAALDGFKDELRILERLYYKCKNQHRSALFFKRVPEIRRYGRRLSELDVLEHVDLLRASFVGLDHTSDLKTHRGPWSHVPEKPHVCFSSERLTACSTLARKMRVRLEKAYHHFALAMQSGAFIQLIILFAAISSRMAELLSELDEALELGKLACNRILIIIQLPSEPEGLHVLHADHDVSTEGTGESVSCHQRMDVSTVVAEDLGVKTEAALGVRMPTAAPPPSYPANGCDRTVSPAPKKARVVAQNPRIKKVKKFDEIDEIFGF